MKPRRPTSAELALWQAATRDVRRARSVPPEPPAAAVPELTVPPAMPPAVRTEVQLKQASPTAVPFDPTIERRILKGQARIDARIDLHGLTEPAAHAALSQFIVSCAASRCRIVLVVTGKGAMGTGILKRNLPRWLECPPLTAFVASTRPAYGHHGGEGAFYVLLRKRRRG